MLKHCERQDSVLISANRFRIIHKPHFISSCSRIIHVELEQKEMNQYNFVQMFWREMHSNVVQIYFENRSLLSARHKQCRLNGSQVIPDGGGGGPSSHKINSGLWCWQDSRVGGHRDGGTHVWYLLTFSWETVWSFKPPQSILGEMNAERRSLGLRHIIINEIRCTAWWGESKNFSFMPKLSCILRL